MTELSSACEAVMQTRSEKHLVFLLDAWSHQWKWRGRQRAIGTGAFDRYCTLGLFAHGGNAPSVSTASSMKEACIAVNRFMRHRFPNGTWTSIAVLLNPRIGLHRDIQNMVGKWNQGHTGTACDLIARNTFHHRKPNRAQAAPKSSKIHAATDTSIIVKVPKCN